MKYFLTVICIMAFILQISAGDEVKVVKAKGKIKIDGKLDEASWKNARDYFLVYHDGSLDDDYKSLVSSVKILWDEKYLYIAFLNKDSDVFGYHSKRDSAVYHDDCVEVLLKKEESNKYTECVINPNGGIYDAINSYSPFRDFIADSKFNFDIKYKVFIQGTINDQTDVDSGWHVEMAIPWKSFGVNAPEEGLIFLGNLLRYEYSRSLGEKGELTRNICDRPASKHLNLFPSKIKGWPHIQSTFSKFVLVK